jgi:hypothetical protein
LATCFHLLDRHGIYRGDLWKAFRPPLIINERLGMPLCDNLIGYLWARTKSSCP